MKGNKIIIIRKQMKEKKMMWQGPATMVRSAMHRATRWARYNHRSGRREGLSPG